MPAALQILKRGFGGKLPLDMRVNGACGVNEMSRLNRQLPHSER